MVLVFDLDGTLVDSVYQHVLAWHEVLGEHGIALPASSIHRRIGMGGGLLAEMVLRESGRVLDDALMQRLQARHGELYRERYAASVRPLPGTKELLARLRERRVAYAIATSSKRGNAEPLLRALELPDGVPVVAGDEVTRAKPDPELFLAAIDALGVGAHQAMVVGDSVWDLLAAQRARALGIGLLCGGFARGELEGAGAHRVYADPADLLAHLDEVGAHAA